MRDRGNLHFLTPQIDSSWYVGAKQVVTNHWAAITQARLSETREIQRLSEMRHRDYAETLLATRLSRHLT